MIMHSANFCITYGENNDLADVFLDGRVSKHIVMTDRGGSTVLRDIFYANKKVHFVPLTADWAP